MRSYSLVGSTHLITVKSSSTKLVLQLENSHSPLVPESFIFIKIYVVFFPLPFGT